jgi:hypothetical protein
VLLVPLLAGYAVGAGATYMLLMQPYELIEHPAEKLRWVAIATLGGLLWPLTWAVLGVLTYWGRRCC